jgi:hypothetical protein
MHCKFLCLSAKSMNLEFTLYYTSILPLSEISNLIRDKCSSLPPLKTAAAQNNVFFFVGINTVKKPHLD